MPLARVTSRKVIVLLAVASWSCGDNPADVAPTPAEIRLLSSATHTGTPGWPLADSITVEVLDANGNALPGVPVTWSTANAGARLGRAADTTNIAGRVAAEWTLGWDEGGQSLSIVAGQLDPVSVSASASIFHAASVVVGAAFACALTDSGRAYCWGINRNGQLGIGTVEETVLAPSPVAGDLVFTALTASGSHVCGLTGDGSAYCWGSNETGETGTGTFTPSVPTPTPVQTALRFTQITAEGTSNWSNSTCGLTSAGQVWCWGFNDLGKLGDGTRINSPVPVQVLLQEPASYVETGFFHSCATTATTGELWCWGEQETDVGAFGAKPEGIYTAPVLVHPDYRFVQLSMGRNYTCGLTTGHSAYCWGANWFGSLGTQPATNATPEPLPVFGGHSFVKLSAAGFEGTQALTTDGVVYRWGSPGGDVAQPTPLPMTDLRFIQTDSGEDPFTGFLFASCGVATNSAVYCVRTDEVVRGVPPVEVP